MTGPHIYLTTPPRALFTWPSETPLALPPPTSDPWYKSPIHINPELYQAVLRPQVPITFALTYIAAVLFLNDFNRRRNWKPWRIARSSFFTPLVVVHNLLLAAFSLATFLAMLRAIYVSWPEMTADTAPAHIADCLCKINGPRGLGDAISYDALKNTWGSRNALIKLASDLPDSTDVGRLWNEGLAFWGWTFYLSKFYEVIDTLVILARGKRSPTLQTYHHAGAMLCMWAGMRYMSPPIWMFVFLNSFIHTLMYVYFTLATLGVKVPARVKKTLTTLQITQFVFGASYAAMHLFVQYDVPVTEVYKVLSPIKSAASVVSSKLSAAAHHGPASASSAAASVMASPGLGALVKRLLLRAAGDEGAAENVRDTVGNSVLTGAAHTAKATASSAASTASEAVNKFIEETRHRTSIAKVDCIDTSGQAFAIWLNLIYLAPLTGLFLRFFIKAYIRGTNKTKTGRRTSFTEATATAVETVINEVDDAGKEIERRLSESVFRDVKDMREGKFQLRNPSGGRNVTDSPNKSQKDPTHLAPPDKVIEDDDDDDEGEGDDSALSAAGGSVPASPEKSGKKKRNKKRKNKNKDAAHAAEDGTASFADIAKEEPTKDNVVVQTS